MDFRITALTATAAIELFAALLFAFAIVRGTGERDNGLSALFCLAAAEHAASELLAVRTTSAEAALAAMKMAGPGLGVALAVGVHLALAHRAKRGAWSVVAAPYTMVALFLVAAAQAGPKGAAFATAAAASSPLNLVAYLAGTVAAASILFILAREYRAGKPGALPVVVGAAVLLTTMVNDLGVTAGVFGTVHMADAGLLACVVGFASLRSSRHAGVARELARRTDELRTRTRELRRSYEDLRTAQEELVKKEQLAVVGELAAVIAHEVRNPLAIIANAGAGLRKPAISREDHGTLLGILDEETSRLNRLVTDLLRYARPVNVQRSRVSVSDLLERALSLANTGAKNIRKELKMDVHEGRLWGDANLLRQVFDNLIDNAVQAMTAVGTLTVQVRATTASGVDGLAVDIIDTGEGMDTQVRSRALDPFFTTRPSGTGLGLAIVDRIVDAHGGHLAIESRAGEGTTVTVFLPHGSPSEPPPPPRGRTRAVSEPPGPLRATR